MDSVLRSVQLFHSVDNHPIIIKIIIIITIIIKIIIIIITIIIIIIIIITIFYGNKKALFNTHKKDPCTVLHLNRIKTKFVP